MSIALKMTYEIDINAPLKEIPTQTIMVEGNKAANEIVIVLKDKGAPADLSGCKAGAYFVQETGDRVWVSGAIKGNEISLTLTEYCYYVPGSYAFMVQLYDDKTLRTVLWLTGKVVGTGDGDTVDPENKLPSVESLVQYIQAMEEAIANAQAATAAANKVANLTVKANTLPSGQAATASYSNGVLTLGLPKGATGSAGPMKVNGVEGVNDNITLTGENIPVKAGSSATVYDYVGKSNAPHDLVTNGNFFAPINQRGQTSYTGIGYTIDRWQFLYTGGTAEVVNAGLKLTSNVTSGTTHISQVLAPEYYWYYYARQLTLAVCMSNGSIQTKTGILTNGAIVTDDGYAMLEIPQGTNQMRLYLRNPNPGTSVTFRWVAVYPGEYTTATLPIYTPKNRAAELAECQRYFFRLGSGYFPWAYGTVGAEDVMARATLHMPTTMRINPTCTIVGDASTIRIRSVERFAPISSVTATVYPGKLGLFINLTMKLQEAGAFILYSTDSNAFLDFSADL